MIYLCCVVNAGCNNTPGSRSCSCKAGYSGDGKSCTDLFFNRNWKINFQHPQAHEHVSLFTLLIDIQLVNRLTPGVFCAFLNILEISAWIWAKLAPIYSKHKHYFGELKHNVLSEQGISRHSTVCGFQVSYQQENVRVLGETKSHDICYTRPFLRS